MPSEETLAFSRLPDRDPELADLIFGWITDRTVSAAERLIDQYLEKDLYLRKVVRAQAEQLCANEDEMATYDDEEKALNERIADLEAQIAKLKPAPAPAPAPKPA